MIKASYEILQPMNGHSFLVRCFNKVAFDAPYHFHEEYELTYILTGSGKRYVGNHMEDFTAGDLVLLGPNLPHCWKLETGKDEKPEGSAIVIQFNASFLGNDFFNKGELKHIKALFERSSSGVHFKKGIQSTVKKDLVALGKEKNSFKMLLELLEILQSLATSNDFNLLDQNGIVAERTRTEQERINPVFAYLVENFRHHVSLDVAASIANMTPNAFCKYFKKTTRKTFMETIIDYRINYATQQLVQTDKPISEISFESGFGDVSHFYKTFKLKMSLSPLNYRKKFMRNLGLEDKKVA
ncbi:AraC-like DNA-binding protein [Mucilaginibacter frigoritolerans]|uniref:AraC-like DNA-binding protein n=1 Tax=Mucilaginibacter frigoritolerans TaxID=652788 RepID=A0A562TQS2_9SPHI|nr:AraC family transcriptional regulator [Mucilaginibacter frigoritolerans]TWI95885.1 AraC-like DNA-binding protein [Mucilaginibacter frigoritolerans]